MGYFEKSGALPIDLIYEFFDWSLEICWENKEIQKYIEAERKSTGIDAYKNFEAIYKKCNEISLSP